MRCFNVLNAPTAPDESDPAGYQAKMARFGPEIGMQRLGGSVYELPPGQSVCPYHWEAGEEELLLVLRGEVNVRHPEGEDTLGEGDIACFPAGPAGAHKITNKSARTARVVMFSNVVEPAITVYPDSNKLGAFDKPSATRLLFRIDDSVGYYEGETT